MTIALTIIATLAVTLVLVLGWLLLHLQGSHARIGTRMDQIALRLAGQPATNQPASSVIPVAAVRPVAKPFALPDLSGRIVSLPQLLASGKPTLLSFTNPKCGPCYEVLADTGGWERVYGDRLTVVTISSGELRQNRGLAQEYGLGTILLQEDHEIADTFDLAMLPAAALIAPDGRVVATAMGAARMRELVASALGLAVPPPDTKPVHTLQIGEPVGDLRRPDLDGNLISLGERHSESTMLLFWSPGCSHCQDLLPAIREWDADPSGPRLVVATAGPVGLNREAGLQAPMIQDDDGVLKRTFGVQGTPAALLIDREGRVASEVARGATAVRAMVGQRFGAMAAD